MQTRNNEIIVHRGETWTMSKLIQNKDGSPYLISSDLKNPYFLVTITSSLYVQRERYVFKKWLDIKNTPRFKITRPIELKSINPSYKFSNPVLPTGYEGDETSGYANIAVFYEKDENGVTSYKYWEYINNIKGNYDGRWIDYVCSIATTYNNDVTQNWIDKNYFYSIELVDGISLYEHLSNLLILNNIVLDSDNVKDMYNLLKEIYPELNFDLEIPLIQKTLMFPILSSTKLYVKSGGGEI